MSSAASKIAVNKGLPSPSLLPVMRMDPSWSGVESEETEPYQMKYKAGSGFQTLKLEEFGNDSG